MKLIFFYPQFILINIIVTGFTSNIVLNSKLTKLTRSCNEVTLYIYIYYIHNEFQNSHKKYFLKN